MDCAVVLMSPVFKPTVCWPWKGQISLTLKLHPSWRCSEEKSFTCQVVEHRTLLKTKKESCQNEVGISFIFSMGLLIYDIKGNNNQIKESSHWTERNTRNSFVDITILQFKWGTRLKADWTRWVQQHRSSVRQLSLGFLKQVVSQHAYESK